MLLLRARVKCLWRVLFYQIISNKWEQKHREPKTYIINDYAMLKRFKSLYRILHRTSKKKHKKLRKTKKTSFPRELVENADFYKPVLNKIMTSHEKCEIS